MAAEGLSIDWYVHRHRTEDELLPWTHISAGLHPDFLWQDWQAALAESGLEDCRWTPCYDCGVCTGYGLEHVVASPVAPAGGSQGTGQDLSIGGAVPVVPAGQGGGAGVNRVRLRFSKLGKVRWTSHRDVARMWERALRRAEVRVAYSEGFSPRPKLAFGLALSTGHESLGEYLDVDLAGPVEMASLPARLTPGLPAGIDCLAGLELAGGEPSLQQDVTTCRWEIELGGMEEAAVADGVAAAAGGTGPRDHPHPQGPGRHRRRPARHPGPDRLRGDRGRPRWPPSPGGCGRGSCSTPASPAFEATGCCAPTNGSSATARAGNRFRSTRRRFRTHCGRAHEKGTS